MTLVERLIMTAEVCGGELSTPAAKVMALELEHYSLTAVSEALRRCQREVSGRLTLAHVLQRLAMADGRLSPDEAWAIASVALDEAKTIVWTLEMERAYGCARELHIAGDGIAARMAFREAYAREVAEARAKRLPASWVVSAGTDRDQRASTVMTAAEQGRISSEQARHFLAPESPSYYRMNARLLAISNKLAREERERTGADA